MGTLGFFGVMVMRVVSKSKNKKIASQNTKLV